MPRIFTKPLQLTVEMDCLNVALQKGGDVYYHLSFRDSDAVTFKFSLNDLVKNFKHYPVLSIFRILILNPLFPIVSIPGRNFILRILWTVPSIKLLAYCKGAQPLKFRRMPLSVGFWFRNVTTP